MRSGAAGRILSASKTTESFLTIRNCRSSFTAARSASRTTLIQRRYLKSCLRATAGAIPGATAFTITCTTTRALTKCSGSRAAMPRFASGANGEKCFTSRPAMWRSCRLEPATSDWPPARTCWWSAHTRPSAVTTNAAPARPTTIAPSRRSPRSHFHARIRCTDVMARSRVFGAGASSSGAIAVWSLLKDTAANWSKHKAARLGAALSYYSIFSLGPLLVIAVAVAGLTFAQEAVRGEVSAQLRALLGEAGAQAINALLIGASKPMEGTLATVLGVGTLMFAALGLVVQLKDALNTVWEVEPPKASGIWDFVRTYGLACGCAFAGISLAGIAAADDRAGCWRQIHCALRAGTGDARARQRRVFRDGHPPVRHDVQVAAGHLCRLARCLARRRGHRSSLRDRQAAHRPLHRQTSP